MYWYCDLGGTIDDTKGGSGCCLRDIEDSEGGGYCLRQKEDNSGVETLWMVEADFVTATEVSEYILPEAKVVTETASNLGFETFNCDFVVDTSMSCSKQ